MMNYFKNRPQREWQLKLQEEFPFMQRNLDSGKRRYDQFGCECDKGWYPLLHDLCQEIADKYAETDLPVDIIILQVKEKFATLHFYYTFPLELAKLRGLDCVADGSGLRFYPSADAEEERTTQLHRDIAAIVRKYEHKSAEICEVCGKPGTVRKDMPWIRTLCDGCYQEYLRISEERKRTRPNLTNT